MENIPNEENYNPYNEINFSESGKIKIKMKPVGRNVAFDAFQISVLFFPVHILFNALFYMFDNYHIEFFALFICSVLSFFVILSDSVKCAGLKWLLSLPITLVWIMDLRISQFNIRILNWLMPDFGEPNMGDFGLASITLMIYAVITVIALSIGLAMCDFIAYINSETAYKIISFIKKVCAVVSIVLAAVILLLSIGMPAYVPDRG